MSTHEDEDEYGTVLRPYRVDGTHEATRDGWHVLPDGTLAYVYVVTLTENEHKSLAWIADRYTTADILYTRAYATHEDVCEDVDGCTAHEHTYRICLREHEAWQYTSELADENGDECQTVPTCAGGTLADKLGNLYERIT